MVCWPVQQTNKQTHYCHFLNCGVGGKFAMPILCSGMLNKDKILITFYILNKKDKNFRFLLVDMDKICPSICQYILFTVLTVQYSTVLYFTVRKQAIYLTVLQGQLWNMKTFTSVFIIGLYLHSFWNLSSLYLQWSSMQPCYYSQPFCQEVSPGNLVRSRSRFRSRSSQIYPFLAETCPLHTYLQSFPLKAESLWWQTCCYLWQILPWQPT